MDIKISFLGDLMVEKSWLGKDPEKTDFCSPFQNVSSMFDESDLVVANLETVLAGATAGYTNHIYSFNTPDEFLQVLHKLKIGFVTTANNHTLDRGVDGLERTISVLNSSGIEQTGTFFKGERHKASIVTVKDVKFALISYTASTNYNLNHFELNEDELKQINLLSGQKYGYQAPADNRLLFRVKKRMIDFIGLERYFKLKKIIGKKHKTLRTDRLEEVIDNKYLRSVKGDINYAKENADLVIFLPHMGGQYNGIPGSYVEFYMHLFAQEKVDLVVATHPHVVQKYEKKDESHLFYSIGNFSMVPDSVFVDKSFMPEYGVVVHLYVNSEDKLISKITYSFIKVVGSRNPIIYDLDSLRSLESEDSILNDIQVIQSRLTGKDINYTKIEKEYVIYERPILEMKS